MPVYRGSGKPWRGTYGITLWPFWLTLNEGAWPVCFAIGWSSFFQFILITKRRVWYRGKAPDDHTVRIRHILKAAP